MDYKTRGISRSTIRRIAKAIRRYFGCKNKYYFDVIKVFECLPLKFKGEVTTEIIPDNDTSIIPELNVPGSCVPDFNGHYTIYIRETVYDKACHDQGGCRDHIMHEMCHFFLFKLGYLPSLERSFNNYELKNYESVEWQAKALAGEILVPYEETIGMSIDSIRKRCNVSTECAILRRKLDEKKIK